MRPTFKRHALSLIGMPDYSVNHRSSSTNLEVHEAYFEASSKQFLAANFFTPQSVFLFDYLSLDSGQAFWSKKQYLHETASAQEACDHCLSFYYWCRLIIDLKSAKTWLLPLFFWNWKQHGSGTLVLCDHPLPSVISAGDLALTASAWPSYYTGCCKIVTFCHPFLRVHTLLWRNFLLSFCLWGFFSLLNVLSYISLSIIFYLKLSQPLSPFGMSKWVLDHFPIFAAACFRLTRHFFCPKLRF